VFAIHGLRVAGFGAYQMQVLESSVDRGVTPWRADLAKGATPLGFAAYLREQGLADWFG
jgi:hypothetical protein